MKFNLLISLTLFSALVFVASCGSGSNSETAKTCVDGAFNCKDNAVLKCENKEWQKIEQCTEEQKCNPVKGICETVGENGDNTSDADTEEPNTTQDNPDTDDVDTTPDSSDSQPDKDSEPTTEPTTEPSEPTDDPAPDEDEIVVIEPTDDATCSEIGGIWNSGKCTKSVNCTGLPENASWNKASGIRQTWNGTEWVPSATGSYSATPSTSECKFKCREHYDWNESTLTCVATTRTADCTGLPAGAVWNTVSSITQTWSGSAWLPSTSGIYSESASEEECRFKCGTNYTWNGSSCTADTKTANCSSKPANTVWNDNDANGKFTQIWNGTDWAPASYTSTYNKAAGICTYTCDTGYIWSENQCITAPTQTASCTGLPANAQWNTVSSITQTYDGTEWYPTTTGVYNAAASTSECRYKCADSYHTENSGASCISNTKTGVACTGLPSNAQWNTASSITQTWNGSSWQPGTTGSFNNTASTSECRFKCNTNYNWNSTNKTCDAAKQTVNCTAKPANTVWNTVSTVTQTWTGSAWSPSNTSTYNTTASTTECRYKCDNTHYWNNSECTNPCDYSPCADVANSTKICTASAWNEYSCGCDEGYLWDGNVCKKQISLGNICTGQNKCYNNNSNETITCPTSSSSDFYGQDAQYAAKSICTNKSFSVKTISSQKVVLDNNTDLMWQQTMPTLTYKWANALSYCENLTYAGYSDWRLPTPQELLTIIDLGKNGPAINTTYFPNMPTDAPSSNFWSSYTRLDISDSAWRVNFHSGGLVASNAKTNSYNVRCVRGRILPMGTFNSISVNGDEIVTDTVTGLIWQKTYEEIGKTWQQALSYCENLTYAGYSDWRLPNKNELASLVNYERSGTSSDFPDMQPKYFWSSSTFAGGTYGAWGVAFYNGGVDYPVKTYYNYVRCVRN